MKFVGAILLAGLGYASFDPAVRAVFISQPTGWIIFEYICLHIIVSAFAGMEMYANVTANLTQKRMDDSEGAYHFGSLVFGILWPVTVPGYYFGLYIFLPTAEGLFNSMDAWVTKRKERLKK